jgi:hypothetical protein
VRAGFSPLVERPDLAISGEAQRNGTDRFPIRFYAQFHLRCAIDVPVEKEARTAAKKTEEELVRLKNDVVKGAKAMEKDLKKGGRNLRARAKRKVT